MKRKKKILIIDDDDRNLFALSAIMSTRDFEIETALDGKKGFNKLVKNNDYEIVLMDIMMPVMDGHESIKLIRQTDSIKNIPIIALSARTQKSDQLKCFEAGASEFCSKPIDVDELLNKIEICLSK